MNSWQSAQSRRTSSNPLPNCVDAEKELVAICLYDQAALRNPNVVALRLDYFYSEKCQTAMRILRDLDAGGKEINRTVLVDALRSHKGENWDAIIDELIDVYVHSDGGKVRGLCDLIRNKARLRTFAVEAMQVSEAARNGVTDIPEFLSEHLQRFRKIVDLESGSSQPRTLDEIQQEIEARGQIEKLPSSLPGLNTYLEGGFEPSQLILYCGYTGTGKTSVAIAEALWLASRGHPTLIVSLELSRGEIVSKKVRMAFEPNPIPPGLPIQILDDVFDLPSVIAHIEHWDEAFKAGPSRVVVIDYAQKIQVKGEQVRERQVAVVAEALQRLGRRCGLLLLVGAQLNRESQRSENGRPALHHIRESGLLEQVADVALLLSKPEPDRLTIAIGKSRWGQSGAVIDLAADFARCKFADLSADQRYAELIKSVLEKLDEAADGRCKTRDLTQAIRWDGRGREHPTKTDIMEAARVSGRFRLDGSEVIAC